MNTKFLSYDLDTTLNDYKKELLFLGVEYYSGNLRFQHLKIMQDKVLNFDIENIELQFNGVKLGGVWLNSITDDTNHVVTTFTNFFNEMPMQIIEPEFFHSIKNIEYFWANNVYIIGIGKNPYKDKVFIYIALRHNNEYSLPEIT